MTRKHNSDLDRVSVSDHKYQDLLVQIKRLLQFPLDLEAYPIIRDSFFAIRLKHLWYAVAAKHQVDHEASYIDWQDDLLNNCMLHESSWDDLRSILINIDSWHSQAYKEFITQSRKFTCLKMADRSEYSKHYVVKRMTQDSVRKLSKANHVSKFYSHVRVEYLYNWLWDVFDNSFERSFSEEQMDEPRLNLSDWWNNWEASFPNSTKLFHVDSMHEVGATEGESTTYLCINVDFSTPIAHAYPIGISDIPNTAKLLFVEGLQLEK